jgi:hypothetical protein
LAKNGILKAKYAEFHSDKDKKIAYLQKIIRVVELMTGNAV